MKKWIKMMLASFFLFALVPMAVYAVGDKSGKLTVRDKKVEVSLTIPEGKTEAITSLRLQLRVTAENGTMDAPAFEFDKSISSLVQDAAITQEAGGSYLVDLILSGKKEQDIFKDSESAVLGILSLQPTSEKYDLKTEIIGEMGGVEKPVVKYVDANGKSTMTIELNDTEPALVSSQKKEYTITASAGTGGKISPQGSVAVKEGESKTFAITANAGYAIQDVTVDGKSVGAVSSYTIKDISSNHTIAASFKKADSVAAPKLTVTIKPGSQSVAFSWKKVANANGYELYEYNTKTKKDTLVKRFTDPSKTTLSKSYKYTTAHAFRMRAFQNGANGSRIYGNYSSIVKVTVGPANIKSLSVRYKSDSKATVSWKKVSGASGYEIYRSDKKNGKYTRIKTVKSGKTVSAAITHKKGKVFYYKVRAYVTGADKKPVYGKLCTAVTAKVNTPKITAKAVSKNVSLSWKKIPRAGGYRIYRSRTKNGKYTLVKTITKGSVVKFIEKKPQKSSVWYYKICAFETQGKKKVNGEFSPAVKVK